MRAWFKIGVVLAIVAVVIWLFGTLPRRANESYARNKRHVAEGALESMAAALAQYRVDHGAFPPSIEALREFGQTHPIQPTYRDGDPFNASGPMRYRLEADSWTLWSQGPDGDDDGATVIYDATNGILSDGDIVMRGAMADEGTL